jgi:hypothetical protein
MPNDTHCSYRDLRLAGFTVGNGGRLLHGPFSMRLAHYSSPSGWHLTPPVQHWPRREPHWRGKGGQVK